MRPMNKTSSPASLSRAARVALAALVATALAPLAAFGQDRPTLTAAEYGRWEALSAQPRPLSPDGRWLVYGISRTDGQRELRVTDLQSSKSTSLAFGEQPAFSGDSQWLADIVGFSEADEAALKKAKKPVHKKLRLTRLATGETMTIDGVEAFAFNATGTHLAMRHYPPTKEDAPAAGNDASDDAPVGATLVIRTLASGVDLSIGNASQFTWQSKGPLLAAAITVEGGAGNGVQLFDSTSGQLRVLDSAPLNGCPPCAPTYSGLAWRKDADDLAVLRSVTMPSREGPSNVVIAWKGLAGQGERHEYSAESDTGFPAGMRIVSSRAPTWSEDGAIVFLGLAVWPEALGDAPSANGKTEASDEDVAAVEVWHPKDAIVMPKQKLQASADRKRNMLAAWRLADRKLVQIAHSLDEVTTPITRQDLVLVVDMGVYAMERSIGRVYADVSVADSRTGARTPIKSRIEDRYLQASPQGRYLVYLLDDHYWTVDLTSGAQVNITKTVATSFVDRASDATVKQKPAFGVAGWTAGDESVLLYDDFDIWELRADGSRATRLTNGAAEHVRHRYLKLDPDEEAIDRAKPLHVSLFGTLSKKSGFARLRLDGASPAVDRLLWVDKRADRLAKAKNADVYAYIVQSFTDSPDYFAGTAGLADARQATTTNPFMADYAWGRAELVDYRSERGERLQGVLRYPANYRAGRKYPMVVYMYEKRSDSLHDFSTPSDRQYYNVSAFTNRGYFFFEPDIVFRPREPGLSVSECVLPAVQQVVKTGIVDANKVGIIGHSWGGFDTVFLATHTSAFAAAVAGAPITDLVSNYGNHHWSSGIAETDHIETGQQRMEVPLWEDLPAYIRNSAVFTVNTMKTPLLVEFGDNDGTVHWHQGVELYNIARRAGKQVVLLVYNNEDHGLRKRPNQVDYQRRIFEWFDHYLDGKPAPAWITEGTSHLDREREIKKLKMQKAAKETTSPEGRR
jgi:dienelactone hydrolase